MSKKYNDKYYARYGDPRTSEWLFMDNQVYVFFLGAAYILLTKWVLPRLMKNRNPFLLQKVTILYNIGMTILNAWVFYGISSLTLLEPNFSWSCQAVDFSNSKDALRVAEIGWLFLVTSLLERPTTVLIVLRKRDKNLSFLHTFLRTQAPIVAWYGLKFAPGGYNSLYILLTSFINSLLHSHHAEVMTFPSLWHPYWQKLILPALYLVQFTIICLYNAHLYFFPPKSCKVSFFILRLNIGVAILFFIFAKDFFLSNFKDKSNRAGTQKSSEKLQKIS